MRRSARRLNVLAEFVHAGTYVLPSPQTHSAEIATGDMLFNLTVFSPDPHGESQVIDAMVWCSPRGALFTAGMALDEMARMRENGQCDLILSRRRGALWGSR